MIFELGNIKLDADVEKTRKFYEKLSGIDCSCDGCQNYLLAAESFPCEVKSFFEMLGIDPKKATEIITWSSEDEGKSLWYGGFYHLFAEMIQGLDCWHNEDGKKGDSFKVCEGYSVAFTENIALPEEDLPQGALQMEIDFHSVPWKLDKENTY